MFRAPSKALAVLAAATIAATVGMALWATGALDKLETDSVGMRYRLTKAQPPADLAVIAIDDATFDHYRNRQWPYPRTMHAQAIDALRKAGARNVVYDVQFTERSNARDDNALIGAVADFPGTVLAVTETDQRPGQPLHNVFGGPGTLKSIGARAGHALLPNDGGVQDKFTATFGGLETVAVAAAASATGKPAKTFKGDAWIDFRGPPGTIPTYSFYQLITGKIDPALLRGRTVVVGASAPTLQDLHATPTSRTDLMSGPELLANSIWTTLHDRPLRSAPGWVTALLILLMAAVPTVASLRLKPWMAGALSPAIAFVFAIAAQIAFSAGVVVNVVYPLVTIVLSTIFVLRVHYVTERRERLRVSILNEELEEAVRERTAEVRATQLEVVRHLGRAAEWRDGDTGAHLERMGILCEALALRCGQTPSQAETLRHAALLHDIGKIGIPDSILLKEGQLDDEEWMVMRGHTTIGAEMLSDSRAEMVNVAEVVARTHHERWDGTGYPAGLAGEDIPLQGRICAICDVFDALLSSRPYKDGWTFDQTLDALREGAGSHFDPKLVESFLEIAPELGARLHPDAVGVAAKK